MPVTIYDVAKKANVGIGTVSRVINNSPQISPKTREKVLKVIKELKYQPHAMAQSLARNRTNTIACIVPDFTGYFFVELLRSIQREISKAGYDLILYSVDEFDKKDIFLKKTIREKKVDGVMLLSLEITDKEAERFQQSNFPIVLVDTYHPGLDSISIENEYGAYIATDHLIKLGHRKIAMITGQLNSVPGSLRLEGYKKALNRNNIDFDERYVYSVELDINDELSLNHGFNEDSGFKGMQQLLNQFEEIPTAIFIASDIQAIGAIRAIREKNLKIPENIAIVSFDDIQLARYFGLTTVHQPIAEMGRLAVQRLLECLQHKNGKLYSIKLKTNLIIRQSCGAELKNKK